MKGITVTLISEIETGQEDRTGAPIYRTEEIAVENVLVAPASADEVTSAVSMYGRKAVYTLGIPKGDVNVWENQRVRFFGREWRAFGIPLEGIEENIPLSWNKKVMVETHE